MLQALHQASYLKIFQDNIYFASSSRETKTNIHPFEEDFTKILNAQPVSFTDKTSGEQNIGYIAEEFEEIGFRRINYL